MSPEQISAFQAAGQVKPAAVNLVILGLFSAFLLLWVVWVLNDAYRGVTTARVNWRALGNRPRKKTDADPGYPRCAVCAGTGCGTSGTPP